VPEITRVLHVDGILGVMWISRDMRVPWVTEFNQLARESREADRGPAGRRRREVTFAPGTPLSPVEQHTVEFGSGPSSNASRGTAPTCRSSAGACAAGGSRASFPRAAGPGR
jgi:hypothetical protein